MSTGDAAGTGGLAGFSTKGAEGAGVSAALATAGGIEDARALTDEFVEGFSTEACALSTAGFVEGAATTKDCGSNREPLVGEPLAEEAFSAWDVIEDGP